MVKKTPTNTLPKKAKFQPLHWLRRIGWTKTEFRKYRKQNQVFIPGSMTGTRDMRYSEARRAVGKGW